MHLEDQLAQNPMLSEKEETTGVLSSLTAAALSVRESFCFSSIVVVALHTHRYVSTLLFYSMFPQLKHLVTFSQITYTILYVLPFYLSPTTRPSPTLSRDDPVVIRTRISFVALSVLISSLTTIYVITICAGATLSEVLRFLGWYPISILEVVKVLFLTSLLFAGPLFESGFVESGWRDWIQGHSLQEILSSWIGFRNFVAVGPLFNYLPTSPHIFPLTFIPRALSQRKSSSALLSLHCISYPGFPPLKSSSSRRSTLA